MAARKAIVGIRNEELEQEKRRKQEQPQTWEQRVNIALLKYKLGQGDEGWNILRYAKQGRINIDSADFAHDFMEWYPSNPDYLILRLAKAGKLSYKQTDEEKLEELDNV